MANLATKAPNFTSETARLAAFKSHESRRQNIEREKMLLVTQAPDNDDARKNRTLKQIDKLDKLIDDALVKSDEERFLKLTSAKERLWKLVQPTAGVSKPSRQRSQAISQPISTPLEPTA
jgi:predicted Co/Zn/Cd cation transporter (cation efflux family)